MKLYNVISVTVNSILVVIGLVGIGHSTNYVQALKGLIASCSLLIIGGIGLNINLLISNINKKKE